MPAAPAPLRLTVGVRSDVGRVRSENEDAYGCYPSEAPCLFVVADGMGGHDDGARASRLAVETVRDAFFDEPERPLEERLRGAVEAANAVVHEEARASGAARPMGTTCTALAFGEGEAAVAHVGDSRAYRVQVGGITQLTEDHTLVEALRREGALTDAEAERHPQRHALLRAVGIGPEVEVDVVRLRPPAPGDAFALCSDGLAPVADDEIHDAVRRASPQEAADALVRLANERGGPDNVTVLVVEVA